MKHTFRVKNFLDEDVTVYPQLTLYNVKDFMGRPMHIPAVQFNTEDHEPFATITKSFGEFIGMKNCAYIDINNCPFADILLEKGVAKNTGFTKPSGFCTYPLWAFDENFLEEIGKAEYERYSKEFDSYMGVDSAEGDADDSFA